MELTASAILAVQLGAAVVLLLSGGSKLVNPDGIRAVVGALAIPWPNVAAFTLALVEIVTGLLLIVYPGQILTLCLVLILALVFTGAAAVAGLGHKDLECACFGSALRGRLGTRQFLLAPIWVAIAASLTFRPVALGGTRVILLFGVLVGIEVITLLRLAPLLTEHRTQRRITEGAI